MSTNSKITRNVSDAIHQKKAHDELARVRQDADFSLAYDNYYSPTEQIGNALDELDRQIIVTRVSRVAAWIMISILTIIVAYAVIISTLAIVTPGTRASTLVGNPAIANSLLCIALICIISTVLFLALGDKNELLLFWTAHANNLADLYRQNLDQELIEEVKFYTAEALKLIR